MTKEEYQKEKERIISELGKPEYDFDRSPLNESARKLNELKGKQLADSRALKRQSSPSSDKTAGSLGQNKLEQALDSIPEPKKQEYNKYPLPSIIVLEKDLKGFPAQSALIVKDYLENMDLEPKTLANRYNVSYQFVAGLLNSKEVEHLKIKYFGLSLKAETMKSVLRAVKAGDNKILEASVEFLKIFGSNEQQGSKAIEDADAEKRLKELGDELADK